MTSEVVNFARANGESLDTFLKRAIALNNKVTDSALRTTLTSRLVGGMCDGEKDSRLRERVVDRLYATGKMVYDGGRDCLADPTTLRDVDNAINSCVRGQRGAELEDTNELECRIDRSYREAACDAHQGR